MFLLQLRQLLQSGDETLALVPPAAEGRSSSMNTPVFPPSSFILPSFAWVYISFLLVRYSCPSQQVSCVHFFVRRCIPDVWVNRYVLHVHLHLHHLVLSLLILIFIEVGILLYTHTHTQNTLMTPTLWQKEKKN